MKSIIKTLLIIIILMTFSCKTTEVTTNENHFNSDMEKEWDSYLSSIDEIIENTEDRNMLLRLKDKTIKLYINVRDEYSDFPDNLTLKVSRITSKIDDKIKDKQIYKSRYKIININTVKIENIEEKLKDDDFTDDTLSFIGELDDGKAISFTQKDLKSKFVWPLNYIHITSPYGFRNDPFSKTKVKFHHGLDLSANFADPVKASNSGKVIFASKNGGYGLTVMLLHHSNMLTLYAHLSKINVIKGQFVTKGSVIGEIGSTGKSTGPHLHFEIRKNKKSVNPLFFINVNKNK